MDQKNSQLLILFRPFIYFILLLKFYETIRFDVLSMFEVTFVVSTIIITAICIYSLMQNCAI